MILSDVENSPHPLTGPGHWEFVSVFKGTGRANEVQWLLARETLHLLPEHILSPPLPGPGVAVSSCE